jgi:hypothetical protein
LACTLLLWARRRLAASLALGALIAFGTGSAAEAAGSWSPPITLPSGVGNAVFYENASGARIAEVGVGPQISTSSDGLTWSAPITLGQGGAHPAFAIAPNGRAVAVWVGGTSSAPTIQSSVRPPGGAWSAPVTVSGDGEPPQVGIDNNGDAIVAWEGSTGTVETGPVHTTSLPVGGSWTPVTTLDTNSGDVRLAVNGSGGAIIAWQQLFNGVFVASGGIVGGFSAPVGVGPGRVSYHKVVSNPVLALNEAGQAVMTWTGRFGVNSCSTCSVARTASGTWSTLAGPSCGSQSSIAIDGAGNAVTTCITGTTNAAGQSVTEYAVSRLSAGGTSWGTPEVLTTGDVVQVPLPIAADAAGTFVVAVDDVTQKNILRFTSPPGGDFGPAVAVVPNAGFFIDNLSIGGGQASIVWTTNSAAFESSEPVS